MDTIVNFLEKLPTGKIRILCTVLLINGTGILYLYLAACQRLAADGSCVSWEPSSNWLIFLAALAGVDITQYAAKSYISVRNSQKVPSDDVVDPEDTTTSTDVSEIHNNIQEQKG